MIENQADVDARKQQKFIKQNRFV